MRLYIVYTAAAAAVAVGFSMIISAKLINK